MPPTSIGSARRSAGAATRSTSTTASTPSTPCAATIRCATYTPPPGLHLHPLEEPVRHPLAAGDAGDRPALVQVRRAARGARRSRHRRRALPQHLAGRRAGRARPGGEPPCRPDHDGARALADLPDAPALEVRPQALRRARAACAAAWRAAGRRRSGGRPARSSAGCGTSMPWSSPAATRWKSIGAAGSARSCPLVHLPYFLPDGWSGGIEDEPPEPLERPYLAAAGRLVKMKGFQRLIPLMRYLPEVDLRIAGTGPYEPELRALAARPAERALRGAAGRPGAGPAVPRRPRGRGAVALPRDVRLRRARGVRGADAGRRPRGRRGALRDGRAERRRPRLPHRHRAADGAAADGPRPDLRDDAGRARLRHADRANGPRPSISSATSTSIEQAPVGRGRAVRPIGRALARTGRLARAGAPVRRRRMDRPAPR